MSRGIQVHDEINVIVERRGYGANVWRWRLSNGSQDLARSNSGFRCAEDAYCEGRTNLLTLRASEERLGQRLRRVAFAEAAERFDLAAEV